MSHQAEQRRRFKAVLCTKPRTFDQIREERKRSERTGQPFIAPEMELEDVEDEEDDRVLDGFFLVC